MIPGDAIFAAQLAPGVVLCDVSHVLPRHKWKRYAGRDPGMVRHLFSHHSGALGAAGFKGCAASARYRIQHSDWPGHPYTFWLAYEPDRDHGALVVYRCNPPEARSYHTGGDANETGDAVCWQGNLTKRKPSDAQIEMAEALFPWWLAQHPGLDPKAALSFHAESAKYGGSGKKACPGPHVEAWVKAYREAA